MIAARAARAARIDARARNPKWARSPLRIEVLECIDCDKCIPACPPQFGAIFRHGFDVVIVPELCSGCDKCLPACPVDCILPFADWQARRTPQEWWQEPGGANDPYA
ncbi:MAG: 4Fe-4S binding protein [Actinomycetota bacterium]|nr:4Fe-4S binding protein [Actinomycetota bacterium]